MYLATYLPPGEIQKVHGFPLVSLRPLLKLVDKLLLVGILQDDDIMKLLLMIDPRTWDPDFDPGERCFRP